MIQINFCRTYDYYTQHSFVNICYKGKPLTLQVGAGTGDRMQVFRVGGDIVIYSYNIAFDYVGVEVFFEKEILDRPHPEAPLSVSMDSEYFWHSSEKIKEGLRLRKDWRAYNELTLAQKAYAQIVEMVYG